LVERKYGKKRGKVLQGEGIRKEKNNTSTIIYPGERER
jgi:hypothetical protein